MFSGENFSISKHTVRTCLATSLPMALDSGALLRSCTVSSLVLKARRIQSRYLCVLPAPTQITVLSPDATEPLLALESGRVYCIGGIVDRTVKRGLTLQYAVSSCHHVQQHPVPYLLCLRWRLLFQASGACCVGARCACACCMRVLAPSVCACTYCACTCCWYVPNPAC